MKRVRGKFLKSAIICFVLIAILSTTVFAAANYYITKSGTSFQIVNLAVGKNLIPRSQMPDNLPALLIDDRTYVPLRAAVDSVNGDVLWDGNTKTASVQACNTIIMFSNGTPTDTVNRQATGMSFITSIPASMLNEYMKYEYMCVAEYKDKYGTVVFGDDIKSTFQISENEGITLKYNINYNFMNSGTHVIKLMIRKLEEEKWTIVAKRTINVK
ncbi:MAG: stalk domain-containing protein [Clostridiaceae bacterium]